MNQAISGGSPFRWVLWKIKKNCQFMVREHLSHALAGILALLIVIREFANLKTTLQSLSAFEWVILGVMLIAPIVFCWYCWICTMQKRVRRLKHVAVVIGLAAVIYLAWKSLGDLGRAMARIPVLDWLVLATVVGTIVAALWEFFGNKLRSSPQEVRFTSGLYYLLTILENFTFETHGDVITRDPLLEKFLEISRDTLCGDRKVDACIMLPTADQKFLKIEKESRDAKYPVKELPLGNGSSAAGQAFKASKLVYVPDKEWREGWSLSQATAQGYRASAAPEEAWFPASDPKQERFKTALCVPVKRYSGNQQWRTAAVLNFTTDARDPFMPRDFLMAECLAAVLSQGFALKEEMSKRT
ncbi:MAG: hypothetical protein WA517_22815 [Candidatus Acidiferrum sp.]